MAQAETVDGVIQEALPGALFRVTVVYNPDTLEEKEVMCHISGKMKHNHIRLLVGDRVKVVLDPYGGKTTNRIVERV